VRAGQSLSKMSKSMALHTEFTAKAQKVSIFAGCKIKAQSKGGVGADSMSSLTIEAQKRRGSHGMGFENIRRSQTMK